MVKLPSLEDLKKAGSNLVDSAKQIKFDEIADKIKSGVESVSSSLHKSTPEVPTDDALKSQFQDLYGSLDELTTLFASQAIVVKKIENQIESLGKIITAQKTKTTESSTTATNEGEKKEP